MFLWKLPVGSSELQRGGRQTPNTECRLIAWPFFPECVFVALPFSVVLQQALVTIFYWWWGMREGFLSCFSVSKGNTWILEYQYGVMMSVHLKRLLHTTFPTDSWRSPGLHWHSPVFLPLKIFLSFCSWVGEALKSTYSSLIILFLS